MDADDAVLPTAARHAWAEDGRAARTTLSLSRIVDAGLLVADRDGLDAVSMARVAQELGFSTMSLYRHVGSKSELLEHLQDAAPGPAPRHLVPEDASWRTGLTVWARELGERWVRRPWALQIPLLGPPLLPVSLDWMDWAIGFLAPLPLANWEKLSTLMLLNGHVRFEASIAAAAEDDPEDGLRYEQGLRSLAGPDRLSALHAMLDAGPLFDLTMPPPGGAGDPADADAVLRDFGLQRVLDGIEHLVQQRQ